MFTGRPEHLKSFDYIGLHRYSLTFCTNARKPLFTSRERVDLVLRQILRSATEQAVAIVAYCFMPDHLHLLIEAQAESSDCLRFISRAKQFSGFHFKQVFGEPLWQRYGFEHVLRNDEATLVVARYILENPVRANIVERPEEYQFSGSMMYTVNEILDAVQVGERSG
jgi:putative transposase